MAYNPGGLSQISNVNGFGLYRYDSLDAVTLVRVDGYFNNNDDDLKLRVGDVVEVFDWDTAVRTGTLAGITRCVVLAVDANGLVDLSDGLALTITNTD